MRIEALFACLSADELGVPATREECVLANQAVASHRRGVHGEHLHRDVTAADQVVGEEHDAGAASEDAQEDVASRRGRTSHDGIIASRDAQV